MSLAVPKAKNSVSIWAPSRDKTVLSAVSVDRSIWYAYEFPLSDFLDGDLFRICLSTSLLPVFRIRNVRLLSEVPC